MNSCMHYRCIPYSEYLYFSQLPVELKSHFLEFCFLSLQLSIPLTEFLLYLHQEPPPVLLGDQIDNITTRTQHLCLVFLTLTACSSLCCLLI